jgi:hypothetical protein
MKELLIHVKIVDDKIATAIKHKGFSDKGYTVPQIFETIGILENIKQQLQNKISQNGEIVK